MEGNAKKYGSPAEAQRRRGGRLRRQRKGDGRRFARGSGQAEVGRGSLTEARRTRRGGWGRPILNVEWNAGAYVRGQGRRPASARAGNRRGGLVGSVFELLEDVAGEMLLDLAVAGNGLAHAGFRVPIPVVPAARPDEDTSVLLDPADEVAPFHVIWSSATWRTPGTLPLVTSS